MRRAAGGSHMPCQIGITHDPDWRRQQWSVTRRVRGWQILSTHATHEEAQREETRLALQHGCNHGIGGAHPQRPAPRWYVYRFDY